MSDELPFYITPEDEEECDEWDDDLDDEEVPN